jgi:tetratricopeptide (TPR) repeat protein
MRAYPLLVTGRTSCRRICFIVIAALPFAATLSAQAPENSAGDAAVEMHFAAARSAQRDQDYSKAEREYRAVIAIAPAFAEVHMNLGLLFQTQDKLTQANAEFRRALQLNPSLTGANFFLGVNYCKNGEGLKAIPFLKAALKNEPGRIELWLWLATAREISGQIHAEVATLRQALNTQPNDPDLLYSLGNAYERMGNQEAKQLAKAAPGSARSEQLLAESYASSNEWPSAVIHFQNAIAVATEPGGLHAELGEVLLRAGKLKPAIREFDKELGTNPENVRALVRRGEAELIQENVEAALKDWEQAIAIDPDRSARIVGLHEAGFGDAALEQLPDADRERIQKFATELQSRDSAAAHFAAAFIAEQNGDPSRASAETKLAVPAETAAPASPRCSEAVVRLALQHNRFRDVAACATKVLTPKSPAALRVRTAGALLETGDSESALKTLDELAPADQNSAEAAYGRARCYEKLATAAYLRLYQADSDSYRLHELMGDLEAARGDDGKAIEEYRAAIAAKPSLPNLHYSLGHLLWKDLKVPEARVELEAELNLNPRHPGALTDLGDTYLLEHQPDKALPYLERALAGDSGNPDLHRDLGTAYSGLGNYQKAEEQYKIALSADHDGSVHYKLARVYQALGEKENAAREFALSTALNRESHNKLEKQTARVAAVTRSAEAP